MNKNRVVSLQSRLDTVQPRPQQERKRPQVSRISIKELESEVDVYLEDFQSCVRRIKETSLGLEELTKLLRSDEISENAYRLIMDELGTQMSMSVDDITEFRAALELARAKAKLEWAKEKVGAPTVSTETQGTTGLQAAKGYKDVVESDYFSEGDLDQRIHSLSLQKWEDLIQKIDSALSSLSIEDETSIIEQYLSLIKEKLSLEDKSAEIEKGMTVCRQRLDLISERWASIRRGRIEQIMNLELEASQMRDEIKEIEVRFAVGELYQGSFERKMSELQGKLKKVEKEISDIRKFIDDMDMKIFRCSELSRESQ